jgi:hypothetical protein
MKFQVISDFPNSQNLIQILFFGTHHNTILHGRRIILQQKLMNGPCSCFRGGDEYVLMLGAY